MHSFSAGFDLSSKLAAKRVKPVQFLLVLLMAAFVSQPLLASDAPKSDKPSLMDRCYKNLVADVEDHPYMSDNPGDTIRHESRRPDGSLDLRRFVRELVWVYRNTGGLVYWAHFKEQRRRLDGKQRFQLREARMRLSYMGDNLRQLAGPAAHRLTDEEFEQVTAALEDYSMLEVR